MNSRVRSRGGNGLPSTAMTSLAVTSSAGELITRPLTRDAALHDPFLGVAARGQTGARHHLGDALAGFLFARRPRRRAARIRLALAIGAAAAEGRALGEYLAVVLIVAARPIGDLARSLRGCSCQSVRPSGRWRGRSNFGRSERDDRPGGDPRAGAKSADARRRHGPRAACRNAACRNAACRNFVRRRATDANCGRRDRASWHRASATALNSPRSDDRRRSPGRSLRSRLPKSLRGPRSGAPRENFLSPPNFRSGRSPRGTVAVARRPRAIGAIALRGRRRPCGSLRRAACRAASRHRRRAMRKVSCRRISGRKIARPGGASPRSGARGVGTLFAARRVIAG